MKILLLADREERMLWDDWSERTKEKLSDVKLILSAGDLDPDYLEFLVTMLNVPLVYMRGNHDGIYDADGCIVEAQGLRIMGLGGSMRYNPDASDMYTEDEMRRIVRSASKRKITDVFRGNRGFDILLTHAPCRGYGDMDDLPHRGFDCFNELLENYKPKLHCFGHVHQEYGQFRRTIEYPSGTELVNASGYYIFDY